MIFPWKMNYNDRRIGVMVNLWVDHVCVIALQKSKRDRRKSPGKSKITRWKTLRKLVEWLVNFKVREGFLLDVHSKVTLLRERNPTSSWWCLHTFHTLDWKLSNSFFVCKNMKYMPETPLPVSSSSAPERVRMDLFGLRKASSYSFFAVEAWIMEKWNINHHSSFSNFLIFSLSPAENRKNHFMNKGKPSHQDL